MECWLRARPNHPTSVPNLTNALVAEWKQVYAAMFHHLVESLPRRVEVVIAAMFQHLVESLPRRVEAVIAAKGEGTNSILMPMILEWDARTSRCPHTFGDVVYPSQSSLVWVDSIVWQGIYPPVASLLAVKPVVLILLCCVAVSRYSVPPGPSSPDVRSPPAPGHACPVCRAAAASYGTAVAAWSSPHARWPTSWPRGLLQVRETHTHTHFNIHVHIATHSLHTDGRGKRLL